MDRKPMSEPGCFDFLTPPYRSEKPRERGITVISDPGLSIADMRSLVEVAGPFIDHVKFTDHVGNLWRNREAWMKEKTAYYKNAGIDTLLGGIPFEIAAVQGRVGAYMARVAELGFTGVEVSEDMMEPLGADERVKAIKAGLDRGLHVFTELGRKLPEAPLDAAEAIEMGLRDLDNGAYLVVIEKSDILKIIREKRDVLHRMVEKFPRDKLIFETGPGEEMEIGRWLLREFGNDVNLENIRPNNALLFEAMRFGLHRAIDYNYFEAFAGKPIPPVTGG
jgi:phosphosulfolactate synthase